MGSEHYKENLARDLATRPLSLVVLESLVSVVSIITIVTGNVLVLLTIYRNSPLRRPANLYIVSLAATDLMVGVLAYPLGSNANINGEWKFGRLGCWFYFVLAYTLADASILTMLLIAVNRYFKIVKPNNYSSVFSMRIIIASMVLAWVFALGYPLTLSYWGSGIGFNAGYIACVPLDEPEDMAVIFTANSFWVVLPFCFIALLYYKIWIFIRQHNAHMNQSQVNLEELKLTKSLFVVVGSFLVCYLPYIVVSTLDVVFQLILPRQLYYFCGQMVMTASCINPVIYGTMNRQFRREFLKIISSCCQKNNAVGPIHT